MLRSCAKHRNATPLIAIAAALLTAPPALAQPDFSRSSITISPATVTEGDLVTITIAVTNSGDADAPFTDVKLELPIEAMFVDSDGFASSRIDLQQR